MASEGPVNGEEEIRERHKRRVEEMRREKEALADGMIENYWELLEE